MEILSARYQNRFSLFLSDREKVGEREIIASILFSFLCLMHEMPADRGEEGRDAARQPGLLLSASISLFSRSSVGSIGVWQPLRLFPVFLDIRAIYTRSEERERERGRKREVPQSLITASALSVSFSLSPPQCTGSASLFPCNERRLLFFMYVRVSSLFPPVLQTVPLDTFCPRSFLVTNTQYIYFI